MKTFSYRGYRPDGSTIVGTVEAANISEASLQLTKDRVRAYALTDTDAGRTGFLFWRPTLTQRFDLTRFASDMANLLGAGFNIDAALKIMMAAEPRAYQSSALGQLTYRLAKGESLSRALRANGDIPADVLALVEAGEASGRIHSIFADIATSCERREARRSVLRGALLYPAFLIVMILFALLFLAFFLAPALEPIFDGDASSRPVALSLLLWIRSTILDDNLVLIIGVMALLSVPFLIRKGLWVRDVISAALLHVPLARQLMRDAAAARWMDTMSLLLDSGIPFLEAIDHAGGTVKVPQLKARLSSLRDELATGKRLSELLPATAIFDESSIALVSIGEESNRLPHTMKRAAALSHERLHRTLDRLVAFMTPALTLALGLMVGGLTVSVMSALLSINEAALR